MRRGAHLADAAALLCRPAISGKPCLPQALEDFFLFKAGADVANFVSELQQFLEGVGDYR